MTEKHSVKRGKFLQSTLQIVGILLIVVIAGGTGMYLGYTTGISNPKEVVIKGITNIGDDDVVADFGVFWEAWKVLNDTYLRAGETPDDERVYGAVAGMVAALGDPNTNFFPPEDSKKFLEDIKGRFGGIGAEIGMRDSEIVIIAPLKNSPAERAGLQSGDTVVEVDGESTSGKNLNDTVVLIRGEVGTNVVLTIFREGLTELKEITITRDIIRVPTVEVTMLEGNIAHVQLFSFNENAPFAFYQEGVKLAFSGTPDGIVLDLRNNPGGFLEVAVDIAGWFMNKGEVVAQERFREERASDNKTFRTSGNNAFANTPVVVLMNGGSASASEILAGALRDNRNVKLVGEKSFGKGTVQQLQTLTDGSQLKVTVAEWLLPSGETIEKNGLEPDIEIGFTTEDVESGVDPQLDKAVEVLTNELKAFAQKKS